MSDESVGETIAPRTLVISVGGSPDAVLASIERQRPAKLVFFVSPQSGETLVPAVVDKLPAGYAPAWRSIATPSAELLVDSYLALVDGLPKALAELDVSWGDVRADFTGGTKAMSAALVLALIDRGCDFSYVGGSDPQAREKGGLGIVVSGKEKLFLTGDPWTEVALGRLRSAVALFAAGRLDAALAALPEPAPRGRTGQITRVLRPLFEGFREWDRQRYRPARHHLDRGIRALERLAAEWDDPDATRYLLAVKAARAKLEVLYTELEALDAFCTGGVAVAGSVDGLAIPADLCAAACRRARQGGDPEDGVLLLYAAVEKSAKAALIVRHGIDNSKFPVESLGPIAAKYTGRAAGGFVEVPLQDSFEVLAQRQDPAGLRFRERHEALRKLQSARNHSWREHGYRHVRIETFDSLFPAVLDFLGLEGSDLVSFPSAGFV